MARYDEPWLIKGKSTRNLEQLASDANAAAITAKVNALLTALESSNLMFEPYKISYNIVRVTETSQPTEIADDVALSISIANATDYVLPDTVKVIVDGVELAGSKVTYTRTSDNAGTIAVAAADITGDVEIVAIGGYKVTRTLTQTTSSDVSNCAQPNESYETILTAGEGYTLPNTITVTLGGTEKTVGTDYTYDKTTGKVIINSVTGALVITCISA
jgi:hypothetical protein